jgi:hypothetical protein
MCHTTLGDIDVRKVFMKIDTNQFPSSFRSEYYVIHDLWHTDSTWLVCADSTFAIYLKPGDAKFLYIEKADAIFACAEDSSAQPKTTSWTNNGHRIAERMSSSRQVVAFTEGNDHGKLHVSLPAKGRTFPGYYQASNGDNLASGPEITPNLDANGNHIFGVFDSATCYHPSVVTSANDTAVALVYSLSNGNIKIASQPHPDSAWKFATYTAITAVGNSPVVTPLSGNQWFVATAIGPQFFGDSSHIYGFRFTANPGGAITIDDPTPFALLTYPPTQAPTSATVCSRPNFSSGYPVRMAWDWNYQIYYRQAGFPGGSLAMSAVENVSKGIPSCSHLNPQIAQVSYWNYVVFPSLLLPSVSDAVVWDASGTGLGDASEAAYYPTLRFRYDASSSWSPFYISRPLGLAGEHYPTIATSQYLWVTLFFIFPVVNYPDSDQFRIAYKNLSGNAEVVAESNSNWTKSLLSDPSGFVSTPLRTDSIKTALDIVYKTPPLYYPPMSLNTLLFNTNTALDPAPVKVTNANLPNIRKELIPAAFFFIVQNADTAACNPSRGRLHIQDIVLVGSPSHPVVSIMTPNPVTVGMVEPWPNSPVKGETLSQPFVYHASDSLSIARSATIPDTGYIFSQFHVIGDFIKYAITLVRLADTSHVLTLDSIEFLRVASGGGYRDTIIAPGLAIDSNWLDYKIPFGTATDTGMISIELSHSPAVASMDRYIAYYLSDTTDALGAEKRATPGHGSQTGALALYIHPNPFHPQTSIDVTGPSGPGTTIVVYDILGRTVQKLYDGSMPRDEALHFTFDGTVLTSGTYFVRVTSGNQTLTRRIQLLR